MTVHAWDEDSDVVECTSCGQEAAGDECALCGEPVCWDCSEDDQASGETLCPGCVELAAVVEEWSG